MKNIPELTTLYELQECGFGRPRPRHGLKLLYWFAKECIWSNDHEEMFLACKPPMGAFGFHPFENRYIGPNEKLLPEVDFDYYLLGNLNSPHANMLPVYVNKHNSGCHDDSNTDRIIVTDHGNQEFGKIYVTTHKDRSNFDPYGTFDISRSLLKIIRSFPSVDDFLRAVEHQEPHVPYQMMMVQVTDYTDDKYTDPAANRIDEKKVKRIASVHTDKSCGNCGCTIL